jgi:ribosomal protein L35AE/L33A
MATLHVENTVRDFDEWKAAFDKFDRFRAEKRMRSYRMSRRVDDPSQVVVDLEFDSVEDATAFRGALEQIWRTPQSQQQLVSHEAPVVYDVVEERVVSAAASSTA